MAAIAGQEVHPGRDPKIEAWLDSNEVEYIFLPQLNFAIIDRQRSLHNQARVGAPLVDDQVLVYAEAKAKGSIFPPIVACEEPGRALLTILDGNHRLGSDDLLGVETGPAYVVKNASEVQILRLTYTANHTNGLALTIEDRLNHAAHLMAVAGTTQKAAAELTGVPPKRLASFMAIREARSRHRSLGLQEHKSITALERLGAIRSDEVLRAAAPVAVQMSVDDVNQLVTAVNRARSETDQMAIVATIEALQKAERKAVASMPAGPRLRSTADRITWVVNRLGKLPGKVEVESIPAPIQRNLRKRLAERIEALDELLSWLES